MLEVSSPRDWAVPAPQGRGLRIAGLAAGFFLGLVLLVAAGTKLIDPLAFAEQIRAHGLDVALPALPLAWIALGLEVGLGLLLVLGVRRLWVVVPAALLVGFFLFLTGRDYWRAAHGIEPAAAACGCFGNLVDRTPAQAFWQDLLLLAPAAALAFAGRGRGARRMPWKRVAAAAVVTSLAVGFAVRAPALPLDDLATRLKPGIAAAQLCAGRGAERVCLPTVLPEAMTGAHLVLLADLGDAATGEAVARLNEYALAGRGPRLWLLAAATSEERHAFFWRFGPAFEVREAPAGLLRPLYRRLPRAFLLEDGRVARTWSGWPPLAGAAESRIETT